MPSTRKQQIAALVRDARNAHGWTQSDLAERLDVDTQTVGHWERALFKPRPDKMERLEVVLDIDLSAEAIAGHEAINEVVRRLNARMRELGPEEGFRIAADILDAVEEWRPRGRRGRSSQDG